MKLVKIKSTKTPKGENGKLITFSFRLPNLHSQTKACDKVSLGYSLQRLFN